MIQQADIVAIRGRGWLSRQIMNATDGPVSHVGLVLSSAPEALDCFVIEALARVRTRPLKETIAGAEAAYILSPKNVDLKTRFEIADRASKFSAADYGYLDLGLQLLDSVTRSRWFTRHLTFGLLNKLPICSYTVSKAYWDAGLKFGKLVPQSITPADIFEFAIRNGDKYSVVRLK